MAKEDAAAPDPLSKPKLGPSSSSLGVRTPATSPNGNPDVVPDDKGMVRPDMVKGGMSVSRSMRDIPLMLLPKRLNGLGEGKAIIRQARGRNSGYVWRWGEGPFEDAPLTEALRLRLDWRREGHAFVEPALEMPLRQYEEALESTQDRWVIDETLS